MCQFVVFQVCVENIHVFYRSGIVMHETINIVNVVKRKTLMTDEFSLKISFNVDATYHKPTTEGAAKCTITEVLLSSV